jgi:hypothetical protein
MATQPRMSAPIGRVRIKTTGGNSGSGDRWRSAEPPVEAEVEDRDRSERRPRFYPFPLPSAGDAED